MNGFSLEVCVEYRNDDEEPGGPCLGCGHLPDEHTTYLDTAAYQDGTGYDVSPMAVLAILHRGAPVEERRAS